MRPSALTISSWYFSEGQYVSSELRNTTENRRTITGKVAEGERSLALDLQTRAIHELHEARNQLVLRLREFLPVVRCEK